MLRRLQLLFVLAMFPALAAVAQNNQGSLKGTIKDSESGEPLPFVNLVVEQGGTVKGGGTTDFDGKYFIKPITPGRYDVKVTYVGYKPKLMKDVLVKGGTITFLDIPMTGTAINITEFEVVEYSIPLIDRDGGASGGTVTREDIAKMPGRSAAAIATSVGGVYQSDNGSGDLNIRGARGDGDFFYIDGIKVRGGAGLPKSAIEQVQVVTGGVPANFGDATGGIISITTRGPSSKYFGGVEYLTSGWGFRNDAGNYDNVIGLDQFGYNLFEGSLSGPIAFRKDSAGNKTTPLLGFFISGNYTHQVEPRPSYIGNWKVRDDVKANLVADPLRPSGSGFGSFYNTDFLRTDSLENVAFRPNSARQSATFSGKFDVNTAPNMNLTFGGSVDWNKRSGEAGTQYGNRDYNNSLLNSENLPEIDDLSWRAYGRFTQRFNSDQPQEEGTKASVIKNAYYSVMVDYSQYKQTRQDQRHKDSIFNYGYIGKFETFRQNSYEFQPFGNQPGRIHNGFDDTLVVFTADDVNAEMASITSEYFGLYDAVEGNYETFNQIQDGGGLRNGDLPTSVYSMWNNFGTPYNQFSTRNQNQFRISAQGSADIGDHAISIGFEYEQRTDRYFQVAPVGLWTQMRQMMNFHIRELDLNSGETYLVGNFFTTDYDRLVGDDQFRFDYNLRESLGLDPRGTDFVDVDAIDPSQYSLDMFSADDLLNQGQNFVTYFGYDHTGKKLANKPSFDDFFTQKDDNGDFTRPVGAFEPIYIAGYLMDKFSFDDLTFNVGVRVDRFDANQMVLKDQFLLYEAKTVNEVDAVQEFGLDHPTNIPTSAIVYVNDLSDPTAINGYRDGDTWYTAEGEEITDPSVLETATGIAPYLVDATEDKVSSSAFKDYDPQVTIMPRVAFSFPISDEALFFAHYDILSRRPSTGNRLDPLDYYYLESRNVLVNNPNLKPEKTIDYELGFQQVLSKSSSLKISAFYRELRDMVQVVNVTQAYPRSYRTYGNIDFGTVKGFTAAYDLRKTGNLWMKASYTLQFAEGTGSGATSGLNLVNSGQPNLRTIVPLSYDQRHAITATIDYRYGDGKDYNGPVWFGKQVFANTGANFQANLGSGTPYSAQSNITPEGSFTSGSSSLTGQVNGSRRPGQFRINAQFDRNVSLKFGKDEDAKKTANLNVYLLVNNLFNTQNIVSVYRATGNPSDDGYLAAAAFQSSIEQQNDEQSFRELYALKVNSPSNYGVPRTIRLGVRLDF
jgi:outer membrane receptor protein involved in Fe transport